MFGPEIRQVGDVVYMNCGDWIENCTALVEDFTGKISLINFHDSQRKEEEMVKEVRPNNRIEAQWPVEAAEIADSD